MRVPLVIRKFMEALRRVGARTTRGFAKPSAKDLYSMAHKLIGEKAERLLPLFKDLDTSLQRSGLKVSFKSYVSLTLLTSLLVSISVSIVVPLLLFFIANTPLFATLLFGLGGSLFAFALTITGFYVYPIYRSDKLRRDLEDELPFSTGYMAILASAGVSPERIFYSLSSLTEPMAISEEARSVVRDINLFGLDVISALEAESLRTPSKSFREVLEGIISTIHSGSDLSRYLRQKSRQHMELKRLDLKRFSDTLSALSEFYVALLVTGPLLLVIMLAVMAMLGGGSIGLLSPDLLMSLLTAIGIPLGSVMFIIVLDSISPKW